MSDSLTESVYELLQQAKPSSVRGVDEVTSDNTYCATTKLFAKTQYAFYVAFQGLVLALAIAVATSLIIFVIRLTRGVDVTGVVGILGSLVTGAATGFVQKAAGDAKNRYNEAMRALRDAACIT